MVGSEWLDVRQLKEKAKEFVKTYFDKEVTEDEADAICLGYAGVLEDEKNKSAF